jgi:hypothetical protein
VAVSLLVRQTTWKHTGSLKDQVWLVGKPPGNLPLSFSKNVS